MIPNELKEMINELTAVALEIVITDGEDYRIPLSMDEVASRLVNGNTMHDIMENLKEDNHEDKLLMENKTTKIKKPKCKRRSQSAKSASGGVVSWETMRESR